MRIEQKLSFASLRRGQLDLLGKVKPLESDSSSSNVALLLNQLSDFGQTICLVGSNFIACKDRVGHSCLRDHCEDEAKLCGPSQGSYGPSTRSLFQNDVKIVGLLVPDVFRNFNVTHYSKRKNGNGILTTILNYSLPGKHVGAGYT